MATGPRRVVVVGGGFGGASCARRLLRRARPGELEVFLISAFNYMLFTPLLIEAGTGSLEPRHTVVPLREHVRGARFTAAVVESIDLAERRVFYRLVGDGPLGSTEYDHLILAPGSMTKLPPVPGLREHGLQMKSLADALALRDRAIQLLERANEAQDERERQRLLHFVVVGGSFTGVEVAGEFQAFVQAATRNYPRLGPSDCRFTLIELAPRILPALDDELARFARKHLEARGVEFRFETSADEIGPDHVVLSGGERIETCTVIWTAGIAPNPLLADMGLASDDGGWLLTDSDGRARGHANVWALGDCARNEGPDGTAYPATAQHAQAEANGVADNLLRAERGEPTRALDVRTKGTLAALGCRSAVAKVLGLRLSGFPAWFLWRSVYLLKMPGWGRKVRVALDWTLALFFRRPVVELGMHARPPLPAESGAKRGQ